MLIRFLQVGWPSVGGKKGLAMNVPSKSLDVYILGYTKSVTCPPRLAEKWPNNFWYG